MVRVTKADLEAENVQLKAELAKLRSRRRSPRRLEIIARNTPDRAAEALGLVAANTVIRTTVEADMRVEIVRLKADVAKLRLLKSAAEYEVEILLQGEGRIADVFHAIWQIDREESSEDEEGGDRDISAESREERTRLNHEYRGTNVRQFLFDIIGRLDDLSTHVQGITSSYMRRPR
jgi:ribosomal protein L29